MMLQMPGCVYALVRWGLGMYVCMYVCMVGLTGEDPGGLVDDYGA